MYTHPNTNNIIRHINTTVNTQSIINVRKSTAKKYRTKAFVHGNNGNVSLKDNFGGAF
jgi:hypothetical protein